MAKALLPVSRVNTIMKSCSDVESVSKESSYLLSKAAEHFIKVLAEKGYEKANAGKKLDYKHVAEVVHDEDRYDFLRDIMPKKITVAEFKRIMARKSGDDQENGDLSSSSEDEETSSSEEETDDDSA
ncbi:chromatin accessibility complex 16kD protein [Aethina tumida]|uniref:chromatin accessibility complex 16kD protein n=1 Tax=Aethina tumida TaxID=116153 RepID=UPI00096B0617|nr:chromatin accessibility complex 16kD protein [Aethina tumida]